MSRARKAGVNRRQAATKPQAKKITAGKNTIKKLCLLLPLKVLQIKIKENIMP